MVRLEGQLDQGVIRAGPNDRFVRAGTERQVDGADDDRLAGPGLAGQDVETVRKRDFFLFNQCKVFNMKAQKHFFLLYVLAVRGTLPYMKYGLYPRSGSACI